MSETTLDLQQGIFSTFIKNVIFSHILAVNKTSYRKQIVKKGFTKYNCS